MENLIQQSFGISLEEFNNKCNELFGGSPVKNTSLEYYDEAGMLRESSYPMSYEEAIDEANRLIGTHKNNLKSAWKYDQIRLVNVLASKVVEVINAE